MNRASVLLVSACIAFGALALAPAFGADDPVLKYRGAGKSREALDAMQFKPFDNGLWANLSNWTGTGPKADELTGKVVLVVTWASWHKLSHPAMRSAQSLFEKYKDKGLVVVGVHNPRGFETAVENAKTLGITFPFAEDKEGKFRSALRADQDPNIYFVDRAGNLRFAQIDTSSMEEGAAYLVKETAEQAAQYPATLRTRAAETDKAKWRTKDASGIAPGEDLNVAFNDPDDDAYKTVKWPYFVGKVEQDKILEKFTNDPPKLDLAEEGWIPDKPKNHGRLLVVYLLDPKEVDMLGVIPVMNRIQDEYRRDAIVVGNAFKRGDTGLNMQGEEAAKLTERNVGLLRTLVQTRAINHPLQPTPLKGEQFELNIGNGQSFNGIPLFGTGWSDAGVAMVVSTDKKVRWIGNPYNQDLRLAIEAVAKVDPAVQARRKAEEAKKK